MKDKLHQVQDFLKEKKNLLKYVILPTVAIAILGCVGTGASMTGGNNPIDRQDLMDEPNSGNHLQVAAPPTATIDANKLTPEANRETRKLVPEVFTGGIGPDGNAITALFKHSAIEALGGEDLRRYWAYVYDPKTNTVTGPTPLMQVLGLEGQVVCASEDMYKAEQVCIRISQR